jgi:glucose-6-phosphate dehydrogenase assembly protein OpcA
LENTVSTVIYPAQPEQILKGLSKLWTSLGHEEKEHGKPTVLRACAMTLIVATDESDGGYEASQTISELMREHPSRGIVLRVSEEAEHDVEARVLAQCWKPFGKAQQICCEEIEITARPQSWPNIGPTLVGLVAGDLPAIFWCRHLGALSRNATLEQRAGLDAIVSLAQKVIFDSAGMVVEDALHLISNWQDKHRVVGDLEWTRLTPWREPLCHLFDSDGGDNRFSRFNRFEIEYTDASPPPSALYMGAWLSAPHNAQVSFRRTEGFTHGLHRVVLSADSETIEFARESPECATLRSTNGRSRRYNFGHSSLTTLLTEELSVMGVDSVFGTTLARVKELVAAGGIAES